MPSAGAVIPPSIIPLRRNTPGAKPTSHIDTKTFIDLDTGTPDCKIYFTTDGSKPNHLQPKVAGRDATFRFKGPFTLSAGKRTLKAIAVARDGLRESNVVTKTFIVDDAGPPPDDIDEIGLDDDHHDYLYHSENDYKPVRSSHGPQPSMALTRPKNLTDSGRMMSTTPREAWATSRTADSLGQLYDSHSFPGGPTNNSVQLPDGPFNPTNYSGTQVNFWGVAPANVPAWMNAGTASPFDTPGQLGLVTNSILQNLDQPRVSLADLRQMVQMEVDRLNAARTPPQPRVEYVKKDPELKPESLGNGDWKGQLEHIYAHLINQSNVDPAFRSKVGRPKLGKIVSADFDEEDDVFLLTVSLAKAGVTPKPKVSASPPKAPPPKPVSPPPKKSNAGPDLKTLAKLTTKLQPPPKPKVDTKEEKLKKRDPFFETEEYPAEGTLKPWPTFNAEVDCERLRKAMKGLGTDEKTIINILGYRNANQRMELVLMFKTMFGKDLSGELDSELSGNFRACAKALCLPPDVYDASEVKRAIKGLGTDEDALIEILCTRTNAQIKAIRAAYMKLYNKEMEKDVMDDTSGHFRKLLVSQIQGNRDENKTFDRTAAQDDAQALFKAGEAKWGTDESVFNQILCQRSFAHLRAVFEEYSKISKKTMEEAIKSEFSGDIRDSLITVVKVIQDKPGYFAQKMQKAMKGLGTDDQAMVRIVVSRCECDMVQIKKAFEQQFKGRLADWIKDDTSGDYCEILLALIGERAAPAPVAEEADAGEPELEEVEEEHIVQEGTLKPADNFDAKRDAEILKKAMKGLGTDEEAIIQVMGYRSLSQRLEIVKIFKTMFGKDLIAELKSELSGNFCHTMTSLCKSVAERDADELRKAMKGLGTDEDCLVEIICTRSNGELTEIISQYQLRHGKKLEESIISETSGNIKRLLVALLQANRPEGNVIDRRKARNDAKALHEAGEKKFGTDESRFNVILCSRSFPQLRATFQEYQKLTGKDIAESISSEMSGDLKKGMLTVVGCIRSKATQFAKTLYESMRGAGTNDLSLIRTVVSRCEIDMVQIKQEFERAYKQPLGKFIADDTSGDFRKILLALTGDQQYAKK